MGMVYKLPETSRKLKELEKRLSDLEGAPDQEG
jgi:hypothetical protein